MPELQDVAEADVVTKNAQSATPVLYASPEQLAAFRDKYVPFGNYMPLRKTSAGKFTQPLYSSPPSASGADNKGATEP